MSSVFARFHEPTGLEFYDTAVEIEKEVWRFVRAEKNIPKRAWFSHGLPLFRLARQLIVTITPHRGACRRARRGHGYALRCG